MRKGSQRSLPNPRHYLTESQFVSNLCAEDERVDEHPDDGFRFLATYVEGRAYGNIGLRGVTEKKDFEDCQQQDVQRRPTLPADSPCALE